MFFQVTEKRKAEHESRSLMSALSSENAELKKNTIDRWLLQQRQLQQWQHIVTVLNEYCDESLIGSNFQKLSQYAQTSPVAVLMSFFYVCHRIHQELN